MAPKKDTTLRDERLFALLQQEDRAEATCRRLVKAANDAGGPDNITVVVARFLDTAQQEVRAERQEAVEEGIAGQDLAVATP
jgi:serine/threonine protein phosphatase PrpC